MSSRALKRKRSKKVKSKCKEEIFDNPDERVSEHIPKKKKKKNSHTVKNVRKQQLLEANQDEDKTIKRLENLLNLKKRKNKKLPASFKEDGLDYLLEAIDGKDGGGILSDGSDDFEADLAVLKGESNQRSTRKSSTLLQPKQRTLAELLNEKEGSKNSKKIEPDEESFSDEESDGINSDASDSEAVDSDENLNESRDEELDTSQKDTKSSKTWEDIYGRLRDESGNVLKQSEPSSNTYIPPKLRKQNASGNDAKSEECMRISRNLKGLLNRLSQSNLQNICHQIEELYMKYSRNDMNETLFSLMSELLFTGTLTPPRLMMEQAMLIALLHANVGSEIGAYFLQKIVEKLGTLFKNEDSYGEGKECNNVLTFLSHLYNYKVTNSTLLFDIFHILVQSFHSRDIELIQLFLKNIGFVLRKDDPLKLKELILAIQAKAVTFNKDNNDSRVKFMLETLTAIRNNNMYKIPDYDPSIMEHSKKCLKGFIRKGCSIQELSISYEDLLKAKEKGRWWIVGSAWAELDDAASKTSNTDDKKDAVLPKSMFSEKIMELARKQHMNTDVRKSVFCIIMAAEDFMDAFEKLLKLNLKNQQEREIIHVLLHCALQEKKYNPYYAHLMDKFCRFARKHMICLQFSLWDKFKEISKMKPSKLNNLSSLLSHLFTSGALPLSVLKVIHFSDMDKPMVRFFRQILLALLLHDSEEVVIRAFSRIAQAENLKLLRESLRLFMYHFVLKNESKLEPDTALKLKKRVKLAENSMKPPNRVF